MAKWGVLGKEAAGMGRTIGGGGDSAAFMGIGTRERCARRIRVRASVSDVVWCGVHLIFHSSYIHFKSHNLYEMCKLVPLLAKWGILVPQLVSWCKTGPK
jgi:hypothetical protein